MAPARMVTFMQQHTESCEVCLHDPDVLDEIAKITEMILPESKIPKAIRQQDELDEEGEDFEDDEFLNGDKTSDEEELEEEEEDLEEIEPEEEFLEDDED
jgi:protein subunit release factor A